MRLPSCGLLSVSNVVALQDLSRVSGLRPEGLGERRLRFQRSWGREDVPLLFSLPSSPLRRVCKGGRIKLLACLVCVRMLLLLFLLVIHEYVRYPDLVGTRLNELNTTILRCVPLE